MMAQTSARTLARRLFMLMIFIAGSLLAGQQAPAAGATTSGTMECGTQFCFKTPQYYSSNYSRLNFHGRDILISGVNLNHPVDSTAAPRQVLFALRTTGTAPLQLFNQHYVAAQLTLAQVPLPSVFGAQNTNLSCYNLAFDPIPLSTGVTLSPEMTLGEFFTQCDVTGIAPYSEERDADMRAIVSILSRLNTCR
ncbi:MAG: hypothetical protein ABIP14_01305 [Blastocatellia bacterium]